MTGRSYISHPMTLDEAIGILCRVHTRDDTQIGFVISIGASGGGFMSPHAQDDWVRAWATLRKHAHLPGLVRHHVDDWPHMPDRLRP